MATKLGITGWPEGEVTKAVAACFDAWLKYRGHTGPAEIEAGVAQVQRFLILHGASGFTAGEAAEVDAGGRTVLNRAGFKANDHYWVYPEIFKHEITAGFNWQNIAQALAERGMLIRGEKGRLLRNFWNPETKRSIRMFCFPPAIVGSKTESDFSATSKNRGDGGNETEKPGKTNGFLTDGTIPGVGKRLGMREWTDAEAAGQAKAEAAAPAVHSHHSQSGFDGGNKPLAGEPKQTQGVFESIPTIPAKNDDVDAKIHLLEVDGRANPNLGALREAEIDLPAAADADGLEAERPRPDDALAELSAARAVPAVNLEAPSNIADAGREQEIDRLARDDGWQPGNTDREEF